MAVFFCLLSKAKPSATNIDMAWRYQVPRSSTPLLSHPQRPASAKDSDQYVHNLLLLLRPWPFPPELPRRVRRCKSTTAEVAYCPSTKQEDNLVQR
jgi:hypothetical protein